MNHKVKVLIKISKPLLIYKETNTVYILSMQTWKDHLKLQTDLAFLELS